MPLSPEDIVGEPFWLACRECADSLSAEYDQLQQLMLLWLSMTNQVVRYLEHGYIIPSE